MIGRKMPFGLARVLGSCYVAWAIVLGGCAQDLNEALMKRVGQEVQWRDLQRDLADPLFQGLNTVGGTRWGFK